MPTNPAGEEFRDLSGDVIEGAGKIQTALENLIKAAGEADDAHDKLAGAQKDAGKIAKDYADALEKSEERMNAISKASGLSATKTKTISSNLGSASKVSAGLSRTLGNLAKTSSAAMGGVIGVGTASREAVGMVADLRREAEMTSDALSSLNTDTSMTMKVVIPEAKIDKFVEKVSGLDGLKFKISSDTSGVSTKDIDALTRKIKGVPDVKVNIKPIEIDIDTDSLETAKTVVEALSELDDITITFDTAEGITKITEMTTKVTELRDVASQVSDAISGVKGNIDTKAVSAALKDINAQLKNLEKTKAAKPPTPPPPPPKPPTPPAPPIPPPLPPLPPAPAPPLPPDWKKDIMDYEAALKATAKGADVLSTATGNMQHSINAKLELNQFQLWKKAVLDAGNATEQAAMAAKGFSHWAGEMSDDLRTIKPSGMAKEFEKLGEAAEKAGIKAAFEKEFKDAKKAAEEMISDVEKGVRRMPKSVVLDLVVDNARLDAFKSIMADLPDGIQKTEIQAMGLSDAMRHVKNSVDGASERMEKAETAARALAFESGTLTDEYRTQSKALGALTKKYNEGVSEAKSFAGGIGMTEGKMIGAGIAAAFLFVKLGDLVNKFKDAAVNLSEFNVGLDALERSTAGALPGEFEKIRDELSLTREQATAFFETVRTGTAAGVASVGQLAEAGAQLRETFGGDQTERLKEYVDLLKEIPTLEQDLQIGADLDDQAAAIFALAKEGKIETLVDLQAAGLAGGIQVEASDDVKLLNAAQSTDKSVQDIKDGLLSRFFPQWGPQFGAIAENTFAAMGLMGGGIAAVGALRVFLGGGQKALKASQDQTTLAVKNLANELNNRAQDEGEGSEVPKKLMDKLVKKVGGKSVTAAGTGGATLKGRDLINAVKEGFAKGNARGGGGLKGALRGLKGGAAQATFRGGGKTAEFARGLVSINRGLGATSKIATLATASLDGLRNGATAAKTGLMNLGRTDVLGVARTTVTKSAGLMAKGFSGTAGIAANLGKGLLTVVKSGFGFGTVAVLAGMAMDSLANVVGDSSKDLGSAMLDLTGDVLIAAGTIAGFATLGATLGTAIPVIGNVLGAVIGTIAGIAVAATGPLEDFGNTLTQTTTDINGVEIDRFGTGMKSIGGFFEGFAGGIKDSVSGAIDGIGEWAQGVKEGAQGLLIWGGEILTSIPGVQLLADAAKKGAEEISEFTKNIFVGSKEYRDNLAEVARQGEILDRKLGKLSKASDRLSKVQQKEMMRVQESAIALGQQLGKTQAQFDGISFKLADFNKQLAAADVDVLKEIGGNMSGFNDAVGRSADTLNSKFNDISGAIDRRRASIIKDGRLDSTTRQQALNDLHMREIEAVQEFAEGLTNIIDGLLEAPGILIKGFKEESRKAEFDFVVEGGVGLDDFLGEARKGFAATGDIFEDTVKQQTAALGVLAQSATTLNQEAEKTKASVGDIFPNLDKEIQDKLKQAIDIEVDDKGKVTSVGDVDANAAVAVLQDLNSQLDDVNKEIAKLDAKTTGFNMGDIKESYKKASEDQSNASETLEIYKKQLAETREARQEAAGDEEEVLELTKKATEISKKMADEEAKFAKAKQQQVGIEEATRDALEAAGASADDVNLALRAVNGELDKNGTEYKKAQEIIAKITKLTNSERENLVKQREAQDGIADQLTKSAGALTGVTSAQNNIVQQEEQIAKIREKVLSAAEAQRDSVREITMAVEATTKEQERNVAAAELQAARTAAVGNGIAAAADLQEKNNDLYLAQIKAVDESLPLVQEQAGKSAELAKTYEESAKAAADAVVAQQKILDAAGAAEGVKGLSAEQKAEAGDAKKAAQEKLKSAQLAADAAKQNARIQGAVANSAKNAAAELMRSGAEAERALLDSITSVNGALESFDDTFAGRNIKIQLDLSEALMDAAEFSDDFAAETAEGFRIARDAANKEAKLKKALIESDTKTALANLKKQAEARKAAGASGAEVESFKEERETLILAKKRKDLAVEEREQKQKVLAAAAKEASIARDNVDIRQEVIDAELDYLSTVGGSLDSFVQLQNQGVALEREKLAIAEKELDAAVAAGAKGNELRRKEKEVIVQGLKLRKAEFGIQKDIFDKIIGGAFGQIRSSVGAARQRGSDIMLGGGVAKTRLKLNSGMLASAGPGGPQTIEQRRNQRMAGGGKNVFGAKGAGGVVDKDGPTKTTQEKLFDTADKTTDNTGEMKDDISKQTEAMTKKGSIFTHDQGIHDKLDKLVQLQQMTVDGFSVMESATPTGPTTGNSEAELMSFLRSAAQADQERLAITKKELDVATKAGVQGVDLQRLQASIAKQEFDLAKKSMTGAPAANDEGVAVAAQMLNNSQKQLALQKASASQVSAIATATQAQAEMPTPEVKVETPKVSKTRTKLPEDRSDAGKRVQEAITDSIMKAQRSNKDFISQAETKGPERRVARAIEVADIRTSSTLEEMTRMFAKTDTGKNLAEGLKRDGEMAEKQGGVFGALVKLQGVAMSALGEKLSSMAVDPDDLASAVDRQKTDAKGKAADKDQKKKAIKAQQEVKEEVADTGTQQVAVAEKEVVQTQDTKMKEEQQTRETTRTERTRRTQAVAGSPAARASVEATRTKIAADKKNKAAAVKAQEQGGNLEERWKKEFELAEKMKKETGVDPRDVNLGEGQSPQETLDSIRSEQKRMEGQGLVETATSVGRTGDTFERLMKEKPDATSDEIIDKILGPEEKSMTSKASNINSMISASDGSAFSSRMNFKGDRGAESASGFGGDKTSFMGDGKATSGFGGDKTSFAGGQALKDPGGAMSGDSFKNFQGQTAKDIAAAANASRGVTESVGGKPAFLGGAVGTAAAQFAAGNDGLTASGETRGAVIERLQEKAAEERQAKADANTDIVSGSRKEGSDDMALITPYGEMQTAETRKMNDANDKQKRDEMLARSRANDTGPTMAPFENEAMNKAFDEAEDMFDGVKAEEPVATTQTTSSPTTTTTTTTTEASPSGGVKEEPVTTSTSTEASSAGGVKEEPASGNRAVTTSTFDDGSETVNTRTGGESLSESTGASVTGAKAAEGVKGMAAVPVQSSNIEQARSQQDMSSLDNSQAFQNSGGLSNLNPTSAGNAEAMTMKVEGTMRVEFNHAAFKSTIAAVVGEVVVSAENIQSLSKKLQSEGFVSTKN